MTEPLGRGVNRAAAMSGPDLAFWRPRALARAQADGGGGHWGLACRC